MKKVQNILKLLFSRMVIVGLLLAVQFGIIVFGIWQLADYFYYLYAAFFVISIAAVLWIMSRQDNPAYKLAWVIPILLFPAFGGLFYLFFGTNKVSKKFRRRIELAEKESAHLLVQDETVMKEIEQDGMSIARQVAYIRRRCVFPVYKNTQTEYLSPGEVKFERLLEALRGAAHFIFLEYFIIEEGEMWDPIFDLLRQKVRKGVEVRVMYDDVGCLNTLPSNYHKVLESYGIRCCVFNPFRPVLSIKLNNRDHRKIAVIDGYIGFTGGINLADEYINAYEKHGHWKDASIMLTGDAVWNLTVMFLEAWQFTTGELLDFENYRPHSYYHEAFESDGYVQPFADSPLDNENVGELSYINMIARAKRYVYINTPYLIIDNELITMLTLAAKSGVDVRITLPHIADKWYVHLLTRSYYAQLIECGVRIYEYTPGFLHSKTFLADDEVGIIGTTNLDYRSLYLHFECGAWLYKTRAVHQLKNDYLNTLKVCHEISLDEARSEKLLKRIIRTILKAFAPLM